jgi:hypothetical protein
MKASMKFEKSLMDFMKLEGLEKLLTERTGVLKSFKRRVSLWRVTLLSKSFRRFCMD